MISCVYKIINLVDGKFYIGSAMNFDNRIRTHLRELRNNIHINTHLQNAYNKYGKDSFIFHILEICTPDRLFEIEQYYLDALNPHYNVSKSSYCPMKGRKHSQETLDKFKEREPWNKGIPRTDEEKFKMSETRKLMYSKMTKQEKLDIAAHLLEYSGKAFLGKHHTEENKKNLRELRKSKKRIICINTGEIFEAQIDIQRKYGLRQGHISEVLNGKRKSVKGFIFKYEE